MFREFLIASYQITKSLIVLPLINTYVLILPFIYAHDVERYFLSPFRYLSAAKLGETIVMDCEVIRQGEKFIYTFLLREIESFGD